VWLIILSDQLPVVALVEPLPHQQADGTQASKLLALPFDLHVLSMPPAFNLSQDQTL
jgi:hypothetical protein